MADVITIHATLDLVYSPDDEGWYFNDHDEDACSILYATKAEALRALKADSIVWES